ncbi:MAG: holo-ACP synthase [Heliobacteriaceae bacterium]|nr:holo-ACP synthase [Heliobacteriaceae bacterium]
MGVDSWVTGCDIVKVARIQRAAGRHRAFLQRVFSGTEISECRGRADPWPSFAARFAAKEAVIKALPRDYTPRWREIEITRDLAGKPRVNFTGLTAAYVGRTGWTGWTVSLAHEKEYAMATVIAWREEASLCT